MILYYITVFVYLAASVRIERTKLKINNNRITSSRLIFILTFKHFVNGERVDFAVIFWRNKHFLETTCPIRSPVIYVVFFIIKFVQITQSNARNDFFFSPLLYPL